MGFVDAILAARQQVSPARAWPVGVGTVAPWDKSYGHDQSEFSPEEYGEALATSSDVYAACQLRARLMSELDLRFYRGRGNEKKLIEHGPAVDLHREVNPFWSAERLARMDELSMGVFGQSFWALEPGAGGVPGEIWWLKPSRCKPVPHEVSYLGGFIYEPILGGPPIHFETHEVAWFRYPNPLDEFSPLSPLAAAKLAAETSSAMMQANRNLFTNGMMAGGVVVPGSGQPAFSTQQAEDLALLFDKRMKGVDKAHRWLVLRYEAKLQSLNVSPRDAEFVSGLNLTLRQVCNAYGLPVTLLNDLSGVGQSGTSDAERLVWTMTLRSDSRLRAAEIREQYLPRFRRRGGPDHCEYDYAQVAALQESATETWTRDAQALDRGAITINEWRARNGLPQVDWGNAPWLPLNKAQFVDGKLVVSTAQAGAPGDRADAEPTGVTDPTLIDPDKLLALPDDEVNPVNLPAQSKGELVERGFDHNAARRLLAEAFGEGHRLNGHALTSR